MFIRVSYRSFHSKNSVLFNAGKSELAKLRKKTGYTFANCKKALELNNNDISLAEKWLKEQAQALGWSKLAKLEGRTAAQGLIGICNKDSAAVMIEVNCETDFVARNKNFVSLVKLATQTCLGNLSGHQDKKPLSKFVIDNKELSGLIASDGKTLSDHNALAVSSLGENLVLKRAVGLKSNGKFMVSGYTHPTSVSHTDGILTGKYGVLLAYTAPSNDSQIQNTARQLCQHIVGMDPVKIGVLGEDEPCENKDDETVMLHQEFLLDPSITVSQVVSDVGIDLIDFVRFECGERITSSEHSNVHSMSN